MKKTMTHPVFIFGLALEISKLIVSNLFHFESVHSHINTSGRGNYMLFSTQVDYNGMVMNIIFYSIIATLILYPTVKWFED